MDLKIDEQVQPSRMTNKVRKNPVIHAPYPASGEKIAPIIGVPNIKQRAMNAMISY